MSSTPRETIRRTSALQPRRGGNVDIAFRQFPMLEMVMDKNASVEKWRSYTDKRILDPPNEEYMKRIVADSARSHRRTTAAKAGPGVIIAADSVASFNAMVDDAFDGLIELDNNLTRPFADKHQFDLCFWGWQILFAVKGLNRSREIYNNGTYDIYRRSYLDSIEKIPTTITPVGFDSAGKVAVQAPIYCLADTHPGQYSRKRDDSKAEPPTAVEWELNDGTLEQFNYDCEVEPYYWCMHEIDILVEQAPGYYVDTEGKAKWDGTTDVTKSEFWYWSEEAGSKGYKPAVSRALLIAFSLLAEQVDHEVRTLIYQYQWDNPIDCDAAAPLAQVVLKTWAGVSASALRYCTVVIGTGKSDCSVPRTPNRMFATVNTRKMFDKVRGLTIEATGPTIRCFTDLSVERINIGVAMMRNSAMGQVMMELARQRDEEESRSNRSERGRSESSRGRGRGRGRSQSVTRYTYARY